MKGRLFLTLIFTVLICLAGWTAHASLQTNTAAKTKWEYTVVRLDENFSDDSEAQSVRRSGLGIGRSGCSLSNWCSQLPGRCVL